MMRRLFTLLFLLSLTAQAQSYTEAYLFCAEWRGAKVSTMSVEDFMSALGIELEKENEKDVVEEKKPEETPTTKERPKDPFLQLGFSSSQHYMQSIVEYKIPEDETKSLETPAYIRLAKLYQEASTLMEEEPDDAFAKNIYQFIENNNEFHNFLYDYEFETKNDFCKFYYVYAGHFFNLFMLNSVIADENTDLSKALAHARFTTLLDSASRTYKIRKYYKTKEYYNKLSNSPLISLIDLSLLFSIETGMSKDANKTSLIPENIPSTVMYLSVIAAHKSHRRPVAMIHDSYRKKQNQDLRKELKPLREEILKIEDPNHKHSFSLIYNRIVKELAGGFLGQPTRHDHGTNSGKIDDPGIDLKTWLIPVLEDKRTAPNSGFQLLKSHNLFQRH